MTPEKRTEEIQRLGAEYAKLGAVAAKLLAGLRRLHDLSPKHPKIVEVVQQIRRITEAQAQIDAELYDLGVGVANCGFADVVPDEMPPYLGYNELAIRDGRSSTRWNMWAWPGWGGL